MMILLVYFLAICTLLSRELSSQITISSQNSERCFKHRSRFPFLASLKDLTNPIIFRLFPLKSLKIFLVLNIVARLFSIAAFLANSGPNAPLTIFLKSNYPQELKQSAYIGFPEKDDMFKFNI